MEKSKFLFLMCGIPGSGKSTWIDKHINKDMVKIVSRDAIRFSMVAENEEYFSKEKEVFKKFIDEIIAGLEDETKDMVIADATHLNTASRTKVLNALGGNLKNIKVGVIFFKPNLELALERNENRKDTRAYVPRGVIRRMESQFERPTEIEGFDLIIEVDGVTSNSKIIVEESDI